MMLNFTEKVLFFPQAEHRTMAVFILAVIVNSYNTGQVRTCVRERAYLDTCVLPHCFWFASQKPKGRTYHIIHLLIRSSAGCFGARRHFERLLHRPLCISGRYWLCDSFVTNSHLYNPVSVPATSMVTLYHHKCHFGLLLASGVQSQKPFVPDTDQTSKGAMLG